MIYAVMAVVLGFAAWQIYRFVRRLRSNECPSGDCPSCGAQSCCSRGEERISGK